ncbi:hypothetical protein [Mesorhizobium sp. WSM3876]|uniref:hypothetical protein n=1 Tax=Mesorhizobium sp. WSM3876 TaxID=422277 RepID=UPI001596996A|nr:hypothetical protein [Mesorhizobium sp. WSM3876]
MRILLAGLLIFLFIVALVATSSGVLLKQEKVADGYACRYFTKPSRQVELLMTIAIQAAGGDRHARVGQLLQSPVSTPCPMSATGPLFLADVRPVGHEIRDRSTLLGLVKMLRADEPALERPK